MMTRTIASAKSDKSVHHLFVVSKNVVVFKE